MFLIVLVDVMGFTIVVPLLALYAEKFDAGPLVATTIVSCFAVCSLISSPVLGKLSDQYGRRRMLLLSQVGTCIGFLILAFSTSLWMVFLGRIIDGVTAGNASLANAYVSDHTKPEERARAFGIIGVAFGLGLTIGPTLGGWLGEYSLHLPFLVAAGLSGLSIACTYVLLPKELPPQETLAAGAKRSSAFNLTTYLDYLRRPELRSLYLQFFAFSFAYSVFISGLALFSERRFLHDGQPWTAREAGFLFGFLGLLGIAWQGAAVGRLVKRYGARRLALVGFMAAAAGYVALGLVPSENLLALAFVMVVTTFGNSMLRPVLTSRISLAVGRHEQGAAIGVSGSLTFVAMAVAPPTGGAMLEHHWLLGWALVPAAVALLGLAASLRGK
ncbi:MAG: permease of the major facilitator superfamily [Myxococcales bacterium]|nr:permease of the major facilitator superfamily [Myxococcales bacterium]